MKILIVSFGYPDRKRSTYPFVRQLALQLSSLGHDCCVLAPYNIMSNKGTHPFRTDDNGVTLLRPNYIGMSNLNVFGVKPTIMLRKIALKRALKRLPFRPDVVYAHFWKTGKEIYFYAKAEGLPLFVASGESTIDAKVFNAKDQSFFDYVRGVICVSGKNKKESISLGMTTGENCVVLPNGINPELFHPLDRQTCRRELGFPGDAYIVAFCGQLSHRKGVKVLSDAIDSIGQGKPVHVLFIGRPTGELPTCRNMLHCGPVAHERIATYLNAADIFVLPTLHEGCCNAIVEAMACGLPIVSSDRPFNRDILSADNAILIDPTDSSQVANAIVRLRDDLDLRQRLSKGALVMAQKLTLEERAKSIVEFMEERIQQKV
ncbi:MAG: glycosyltransferase family 4 protein [Bacteroidaceae bacterium]|nr:glycosyltransferase family 4 protein [Bacteroidaceae bacterium]